MIGAGGGVRAALLAALLGTAFSGRAGEVPASTSPPVAFEWRNEPAPPFHTGESILYVIKYGIISAGHATMEVRSTETVQGRAAFHLVSEARTNKTMDVVYKVRDTNQSWMDKDSLCSLRFAQDIREGGYTRRVDTHFDHPSRRFVYRKWRKGKETVHEGVIPAFVQDVLSSLYYIRTRPFAVGEQHTLDANSGAATWPLVVHVRGRESVKVPAGRFDCFRLEPVLAGEGIFQSKGQLTVWVTADERRAPVLLRSRVAVGAFDAEMIEYRPGTGAP